MLLDDICRNIADPAARHKLFLYAERFVNDANQDWGRQSALPLRYAPSAEGFPAPFTLIPDGCLRVLQANPDPRLRQIALPGGCAKFYWHPAMSDPLPGGIDGQTAVVATSSARTFSTPGSQYDYMVKTGLSLRHFRYERSLCGRQVASALEISGDLEQLLTSPAGCGFLPESIGLVVGDPQTGVGMIYREATPRPYADEPRQLIPGFALHSLDPNAQNEEPLLIQLIRRFGGSDPLGYFVEEVVGPHQDVWLKLVGLGLVNILHNQNTLREFDQLGQLRRTVIRDLQEPLHNPQIREARGLPPISCRSILDGGNASREYSLRYDHFIGEYVLRRQIPVFLEGWGDYSFSEVARQIARRFRREAGALAELLPPRTTYRYDRGRPIGDEYVIQDTHTAPLFR